MIAVLLQQRLALAGPVFVSVDQAQVLLERGAAVIDARSVEAWQQGHLPGSAPLPWPSLRDQGLRDGALRVGRLSDDMGRLQRALREAGLREGAPVLVYDAGAGGWGEAGRAWWTLVYLGHADTWILDGGLPAWVAAGGALQEGDGRPARGDLVVRPQEPLRTRLSELDQAMETQGAVLWDSREAREFAGATPYGEARGGHLPGAVHLWFHDLLQADGTLLPEAELRSLLQARGLRPEDRIIPYCTGGVRSAFAMAVLVHLDYPRVAHYDGGTWEWSLSPDRPLE